MNSMIVKFAARLIAAMCVWASAASAQLTFEDMTNRPGSDYRVFGVPPPPPPGHGPAVGWGFCRISCNEDFMCRAWSYEPPPPGATDGICRLKSDAPPAIADPCCVSGVKPTAPPFPWGEWLHERDSFRTGDEMRAFALQKYDDKPWMCEYACAIEVDWVSGDRCLAWSWEATPNKDHICRLFRDERGASFRAGDVSGKIGLR